MLAIAAIAGCGGTPGEESPNDQAETKPAADVKTDGFEDLGDVTLTVISAEGSGGPQDALKELSSSFEEKYPNVTVKISFRDFAAWTKQAKLVASSDDPPDVFAGNQGYQMDGELVKAGLIAPLDEYAKAYGWDESYTPETMQQFMWTDDGQTFGEGTLWGVAQTGQSVGVFANMAKLEEAGVDPASLETFADFEEALQKLRDTLPADEPVIALGNRDQYGALHLWGGIQGAYTPAQDMRDWIFQKDGASFDTEGNVTALQKLKEWVDKGYLGKGDAFNAVNDNEAAIAFSKGKGAMLIAGNWNAATVRDGLGEDAAFFNVPPGESGDLVNIGSTSFPMHISAKTENPDLAAAYLDHITGPDAGEALVDTAQIPAAIDGTAEPSDPLGKGIKEGWDQLVESGGLTFYPDWSSPTMLQTMGQTFQEMLAGRLDARGGRQAHPGRLGQVPRGARGELGAWPRPPRPRRRSGADRARRGAARAIGERRVRVRAPGEPRRVAYLYLAPAFAFYLLFAFGPLVYTTWLSFFDWDGLTVGTWTGLDNYREVLEDPGIRASFVHSLVLIVFYALVPCALGLFLAALIAHGRVRGVTFFRAVLFLPQTIAVVVVALAWVWIYAPDGPLNAALDAVGLDSVSRGWLGDFTFALPALGIVGTWIMFGLCLVLFLAGIQKIPTTLYEAARVDGAGRVREFFAVTLPGLRGELAVALTLTTIYALRTFDLVYVATSGGPGTSTTVPSWLVYQNAFSTGRVGLAAAVAVVLTAIIFVVAFAITRLVDRDPSR